MSPLTASSVPRLPRGVRMRFDSVRQSQILLAPERTFDLDEIAIAVLNLVDGQRTIGEIAVELATRYNADKAEVEADILPMLSDLASKRVLET